MAEHPVITLLVRRMESHPEEFLDTPLRWEKIVNDARTHALPDDMETLQAAFSAICMNRIHEQAMDELLNGVERRQTAERERQELLAYQRALNARPLAQVAQGIQNMPPYSPQALGAAQLQTQQALHDAMLTGTGISQITAAAPDSNIQPSQIKEFLRDYLQQDRELNTLKKAAKRGLFGRG